MSVASSQWCPSLPPSRCQGLLGYRCEQGPPLASKGSPVNLQQEQVDGSGGQGDG